MCAHKSIHYKAPKYPLPSLQILFRNSENTRLWLESYPSKPSKQRPRQEHSVAWFMCSVYPSGAQHLREVKKKPNFSNEFMPPTAKMVQRQFRWSDVMLLHAHTYNINKYIRIYILILIPNIVSVLLVHSAASLVTT